MARFEDIKSHPNTPHIIVQRVADGESLKDIAKAWGLPYKRFLAWVAANGELSDQCKRIRELAGIELRMDGMEILDEANPEDISVRKEQAAYRERLSRDLNKPLFGTKDYGPAGGGITVVVDRSCGGAIAIQAGGASVLIPAAGGVSERVVNSSPEASVLTATDQEI